MKRSLRSPLWGVPREREVDDEIELHVELRTRELVERGMDPAIARRTAIARLGDLPHLRHTCLDIGRKRDREMRLTRWLEESGSDLVFGCRQLVRTWTFTGVAILTMALGIGANAAMFTLVNGVLLQPLGYPDARQLVHLFSQGFEQPLREPAVSAPEFLEYRRLSASFVDIGAYSTGVGGYTTAEVNLTSGDRPLRVRSVSVDAGLLRALGLQPIHGRLFTDEETSRWTGTLAPPLAMLSYELWQSAFGGQALVGRTVLIEGRPHEIVGIMPRGADLMDAHTEVWLPLWLHPNAAAQRRLHVLHVVGRLKEEVTLQRAQAELSSLLGSWGERSAAAGHLPTLRPLRDDDHQLGVQPLHEAVVADAARALWVLQAAVGLVLLIACVNLANLIMVRAQSRRREFAVRAALGASRTRLLRQTMAEGLMLSLAGGAVGVWLASVGVNFLVRAYPESVPRLTELRVDGSVLMFAVAVSVATGVLFGLVPAATGWLRGVVGALKDGGDRGASEGRHYIRRALVMVQVALAIMLVTGATLLVRTVVNLNAVDLGFDRARIVTFSLTLPLATSEPDTRAQAFQRVLTALSGAPGVQAATAMSGLPPNRPPEAMPTRIENYVSADGDPGEVIDHYQFVMGDYFTTMGVPIVAGRGFERADVAGGKVVVVNEALAEQIWKGANPIGRRLRPNLMGSVGGNENAWHTVVGVAKNVKQRGVDQPVGPELYVSLDQHGIAAATMNIAVRTTLTAQALAPMLERLVRDVDPSVPLVRLRDMDSVVAESIRRPRLLAQLLGSFAMLALALAAIGIYGVLACIVLDRRREIGTRLVLGAARWNVLLLIIREGLKVTSLGAIVGLVLALTLNQVLASLLFDVQTADSATIAFVIVVVGIVALVACALPAWRASRLNPQIALRSE